MRLPGRISISVALLATLFGPAQVAVGAAEPPPSQSRSWSVSQTPDGFRLTVRLDRPVPVRAALPVLVVDGRPIGVAVEAPDRLSVSVVSSDPAVLRAKTVRLAWTGEPLAGVRQAAAGPNDDYWLKAPQGPAVPDDPGLPGPHPVRTTDYDLGDHGVFLPGINQKAELRGRVYAPADATGPRPLVLFLHGRHATCYGGDLPNPLVWPCPGSTKPIPSYLGYEAPARVLASRGYHVVSISANGVNAFDASSHDAGAQARAELVLEHLDRWKEWSTTNHGPFGDRFVGKVDLRTIGLMGHSRGGEGVARAALANAARPTPYGIKAALPLAPTDFARMTVPGVAMSVVLPYCDGDVSDLQGQKLYDDSRYSMTGDDAPRSTVTVLGANHNYFNTEWTPGQAVAPAADDWQGDPKVSPCGAEYAGRLTGPEQQAVGTAYIAGFFRLQLGQETSMLPLFDGSTARAASAGRAVVRVVGQAPFRSRMELARFDQALPIGTVSGAATATVCSATCVQGEHAQSPHWNIAFFASQTPTTAVTKLSWTGTDGVVRFALNPAQEDVSRYSTLSLRVAPDPAAAAVTDLTVRITDNRARTQEVPVSTVSDALVRLPGGGDGLLPKNLLRTVQVRLNPAVLDLRHIRLVELRTNQVGTGSVFLSDLSFSRPDPGVSGPALGLPGISTSGLEVQEGDSGTKTVDFQVRLSKAAAQPVTVYAETNGDRGTVVGAVARRLVFQPGQTSQAVSVPITGNTRDNVDRRRFRLVLSVPGEARLAEPFGVGYVLDDDPTPRLTVGNARAVEGAEFLEFPLTLSAPSDRRVTIGGALQDGTAVLGEDYLSTLTGRQLEGAVEPGQTTGVARVRLVDNGTPEPVETFTATVGTVVNAELAVPVTVTGTIGDND